MVSWALVLEGWNIDPTLLTVFQKNVMRHSDSENCVYFLLMTMFPCCNWPDTLVSEYGSAFYSRCDFHVSKVSNHKQNWKQMLFLSLRRTLFSTQETGKDIGNQTLLSELAIRLIIWRMNGECSVQHSVVGLGWNFSFCSLVLPLINSQHDSEMYLYPQSLANSHDWVLFIQHMLSNDGCIFHCAW